MGFIGNKVTEQRAGEQPFAHSCVTAFNVAERNAHQTQLRIIAIEWGTIHRKVNGKTLIVVDDFGFGGLENHILGNTSTFVVDDDTEFSGNARLNLVESEGIVAKDVALHEVIHIEVGAWVNRKVDGIQVINEFIWSIGVDEGECATEVVNFRFNWSGLFCRNEQNFGHTVHSGT